MIGPVVVREDIEVGASNQVTEEWNEAVPLLGLQTPDATWFRVAPLLSEGEFMQVRRNSSAGAAQERLHHSGKRSQNIARAACDLANVKRHAL